MESQVQNAWSRRLSEWEMKIISINFSKLFLCVAGCWEQVSGGAGLSVGCEQGKSFSRRIEGADKMSWIKVSWELRQEIKTSLSWATVSWVLSEVWRGIMNCRNRISHWEIARGGQIKVNTQLKAMLILKVVLVEDKTIENQATAVAIPSKVSHWVEEIVSDPWSYFQNPWIIWNCCWLTSSLQIWFSVTSCQVSSHSDGSNNIHHSSTLLWSFAVTYYNISNYEYEG